MNETGIEQTEKVSDRLEKEDFDAAYSSNLERTYETTRIIAEKQGLNPERIKEFREIDLGVEVGERFIGKLNELRAKHSNDKILVGSHSVAIKALVMKVLNLEGNEYKKLDLDNTSITVLEHDKEYGWVVEKLNNSAHPE